MFSSCVKRKKRREEKIIMDQGNLKNNFDLVLAPFQPTTRVVLEVSLNKEKSTTSILNVRNPSNKEITVYITKRPIPEKYVDFSFTEAIIPPKETAILYIYWSPKICVTWWDILQLTDNNRNKYEVTLIMRSKDPPQKYLKTRIPKKIIINGSEIPQPKKLLTFKKEYLPGQKFPTLKRNSKRPRSADKMEFETLKKEEVETSIKENTKLKRPRKDSISFNKKLFNLSTNRRRSLFKNRSETSKKSFFERVFRRESLKSRKSIEKNECSPKEVRENEINENLKNESGIREQRRESFLDRFKDDSVIRDLRRETFIIPSKCDVDINCNVQVTPSKVESNFEGFDMFSSLAGIVSSTPKSSSKNFCRRVEEGEMNEEKEKIIDCDSDNGSDFSDVGDYDDDDDEDDNNDDDNDDIDNDINDNDSNDDSNDNDNDTDNERENNDSSDNFGNSLSVTVIRKIPDQKIEKETCELPAKDIYKLPIEENCETPNKDFCPLSIEIENGFVSSGEFRINPETEFCERPELLEQEKRVILARETPEFEINELRVISEGEKREISARKTPEFSVNETRVISEGEKREISARKTPEFDINEIRVISEGEKREISARKTPEFDINEIRVISEGEKREISARETPEFEINEIRVISEGEKREISARKTPEFSLNETRVISEGEIDEISARETPEFEINEIRVILEGEKREISVRETPEFARNETRVISAMETREFSINITRVISEGEKREILARKTPECSVNETRVISEGEKREISVKETSEFSVNESHVISEGETRVISAKETSKSFVNETCVISDREKREIPVKEISEFSANETRVISEGETCVISAKETSKSLLNETRVISNKEISECLVNETRVISKEKIRELLDKETIEKKFIKNSKNSSLLSTSLNKKNESLNSTDDNNNWSLNQEQEFKKWLNALMTPPADFNETTTVDIGKIWQSIRTMNDDILAESRESISSRYHTDTRLDTLRKAARKMYLNYDLTISIASAMKCIENGKVEIKKDKNLHLDIGLQKELIELFLNYNPLWLRIGLETIYNERLNLKSNNDLIGITRFLLSRFFSNSTIIREHSHSSGLLLESFRGVMNDFILKTFLRLIGFLDYAKMNKLIGDDPCLFRKNSLHKESRMILIKFSSLVLGGIGDIIKVLRISGYVVKHRQSYIEEFDYAVHDMNYDLRDGVRLCRVMEIVTGKKNLTQKCSVPANSKVQKIYNVKIALDALKEAGYVIFDDIEAKNIADGLRDKTLSLLWQIVYKFQAPRFLKAAILLQNWWRSKIFYIRYKKFLKEKKIHNAALVIQKWWRSKRELKLRDRTEAIIFLQKFSKARKLMLRQREQFMRVKEAFSLLQARCEINDKERIKRENAAKIIQKKWREKLNKNLVERKEFLIKQKSAIKIQIYWRNYRKMIETRQKFLQIKFATIIIQKKWRAIILDRKNFVKQQLAIILIQKYWRQYLMIKEKAAIIIQQKWRAWKLMKKERDRFLKLKNATKIITDYWLRRKQLLMDRGEFLKKRTNTIFIQKYWRSYCKMKVERENFLKIKFFTILIQKKWRAIKFDREKLKNMHLSARKIQYYWRNYLLKKQQEKARLENERKFKGTNSLEFSTKTLALRLRESIDIFKMTNDLGRLSMCLASLDLITRLSNKSCIIVCNVGLVDKIYETLLRSNRSLPWIEASLRATSILINLAKYSPTKSFVLKENYIEILARSLSVTVEKNVNLFLHLATLMWILIEDCNYAKAVRKNSRAVWLLKTLEEKVRRKKNFFYLKEKKFLPNSKPDWGLEQTEPRLFKNVYHATISIVNRLGKY
ncbi:protein abnormal spindle-like [Leptopilina boulardi]|uniref:protein abnormal spindle-like n=1 Tax=Leptopilina boulardi TaxID=63433 RepID=UPI0021F594C1|nr:protein abnormal spindle-like [Leptopilina boulardi]